MVKAKIITTDSYTKLYFNNICITYTDNKVLEISFCNNEILENYPQVDLPDSFFGSVLNSINEHQPLLNEMSRKFRTGIYNN